jgi:hypothetical protein
MKHISGILPILFLFLSCIDCTFPVDEVKPFEDLYKKFYAVNTTTIVNPFKYKSRCCVDVKTSFGIQAPYGGLVKIMMDTSTPSCPASVEDSVTYELPKFAMYFPRRSNNLFIPNQEEYYTPTGDCAKLCRFGLNNRAGVYYIEKNDLTIQKVSVNQCKNLVGDLGSDDTPKFQNFIVADIERGSVLTGSHREQNLHYGIDLGKYAFELYSYEDRSFLYNDVLGELKSSDSSDTFYSRLCNITRTLGRKIPSDYEYYSQAFVRQFQNLAIDKLNEHGVECEMHLAKDFSPHTLECVRKLLLKCKEYVSIAELEDSIKDRLLFFLDSGLECYTIPEKAGPYALILYLIQVRDILHSLFKDIDPSCPNIFSEFNGSLYNELSKDVAHALMSPF